jgi:hypothetical protein
VKRHQYPLIMWQKSGSSSPSRSKAKISNRLPDLRIENSRLEAERSN